MILERFEMLDAVLECRPVDGTIECRACIPESSPVFEGHFPHFAVLPGVLMIETIAQAAGFLLIAECDAERMPFLSGIDKARFRGFAEPRQILSVYASIVHSGSGFAICSGRIERDATPIARADLRLAMKDFPNAAMRDRLLARRDLLVRQGEMVARTGALVS